jgi:hypothetical protein
MKVAPQSVHTDLMNKESLSALFSLMLAACCHNPITMKAHRCEEKWRRQYQHKFESGSQRHRWQRREKKTS